jgi:hypothetical protein
MIKSNAGDVARDSITPFERANRGELLQYNNCLILGKLHLLQSPTTERYVVIVN